MKTAGIICEYNPFHFGHAGHIEKTRQILGDKTAIICVMSGNFVQRGDFAILNKHARAEMAIHCGADLVIELPAPYALMSAEGFAKAGVYLLDMLGICDYLSFGSEAGNIELLYDAAETIASNEADILTGEWLGKGLSYASAQQKAAEALIGERADIFKLPNNVLGIEYIKALIDCDSSIQPLTMPRTGGDHDSDTGFSASAIRKAMINGNVPEKLMPEAAVSICSNEILSGRGPVSIKNAEQAILSRLRTIEDYSDIPGISEGLGQRFKRNASNEPSISLILEKVKTKRYTMSRLRRTLICAVLNIRTKDIKTPPPYIRVLAMNSTGMDLLGKARKKVKLPVITKPAAVYKMDDHSIKMFELEAAATDFYVLAYPDESQRTGGQEWRQSPIILK